MARRETAGYLYQSAAYYDRAFCDRHANVVSGRLCYSRGRKNIPISAAIFSGNQIQHTAKMVLVTMGDNRSTLQTYLRISAGKATSTVMVLLFHLSPVIYIRLKIAQRISYWTARHPICLECCCETPSHGGEEGPMYSKARKNF